MKSIIDTINEGFTENINESGFINIKKLAADDANIMSVEKLHKLLEKYIKKGWGDFPFVVRIPQKEGAKSKYGDYYDLESKLFDDYDSFIDVVTFIGVNAYSSINNK
jgi:hypothetical protein